MAGLEDFATTDIACQVLGTFFSTQQQQQQQQQQVAETPVQSPVLQTDGSNVFGGTAPVAAAAPTHHRPWSLAAIPTQSATTQTAAAAAVHLSPVPQGPAQSAAVLVNVPKPKAKPKRRRRKPQKPGKTAKNQERHFVVHNYHDRSDEVDADALDPAAAAAKRRGGVATSFPTKLHTVLDQVERDGYTHIVSWQPHGRCFVIHKPKEFVADVMPRYFRQTKLTSFQRQLNLYGFNRITRGPDEGGYYNEYFLRGKIFLCKHMVRTKVKGTRFKAASSPENEPNFYTMKPVVPTAANAAPVTAVANTAAPTGTAILQSSFQPIEPKQQRSQLHQQLHQQQQQQQHYSTVDSKSVDSGNAKSTLSFLSTPAIPPIPAPPQTTYNSNNQTFVEQQQPTQFQQQQQQQPQLPAHFQQLDQTTAQLFAPFNLFQDQVFGAAPAASNIGADPSAAAVAAAATVVPTPVLPTHAPAPAATTAMTGVTDRAEHGTSYSDQFAFAPSMATVNVSAKSVSTLHSHQISDSLDETVADLFGNDAATATPGADTIADFVHQWDPTRRNAYAEDDMNDTQLGNMLDRLLTEV